MPWGPTIITPSMLAEARALYSLNRGNFQRNSKMLVASCLLSQLWKSRGMLTAAKAVGGQCKGRWPVPLHTRHPRPAGQSPEGEIPLSRGWIRRVHQGQVLYVHPHSGTSTPHPPPSFPPLGDWVQKVVDKKVQFHHPIHGVAQFPPQWPPLHGHYTATEVDGTIRYIHSDGRAWSIHYITGPPQSHQKTHISRAKKKNTSSLIIRIKRPKTAPIPLPPSPEWLPLKGGPLIPGVTHIWTNCHGHVRVETVWQKALIIRSVIELIRHHEWIQRAMRINLGIPAPSLILNGLRGWRPPSISLHLHLRATHQAFMRAWKHGEIPRRILVGWQGVLQKARASGSDSDVHILCSMPEDLLCSRPHFKHAIEMGNLVAEHLPTWPPFLSSCADHIRTTLSPDIPVDMVYGGTHIVNHCNRTPLSMDWKQRTTCRLWEHQECAVHSVISPPHHPKGQFFCSGVLVIPCGAGKSLIGVSIATMQNSLTLVLCINVNSVLQWRDEFLTWNTIPDDRILCVTSYGIK